MPVSTRITTIQVVAEKNKRSASELARIGPYPVTVALAGLARILRSEQIPEPAHGLDHIDAELFPDAPDEHLDGVGVAVEILVVEMLDQFGARHHPAAVMHQVGQKPIFVAGEL